MRRRLYIQSVCAVSILFANTGVQAQPRTIYRETFGFCTASSGKAAADQTNWAGYVNGNLKERISNLKVFGYGVGDVGNSVNSSPAGLAQGYSFWWKPVYGLSVLTSEFQFDVGILKNTSTVVEYQQRLSGIDPNLQPNSTRLIIRVDDTWYISSEFVQQIKPARWEAVQIVPALLTYGTTPVVRDRGPRIPESYGVPLPLTGVVKAFGLFMSEVNGRVRFDNFVIKADPPADSGIDTGLQEPQVSVCPASSPDVTGGGASPTPLPDDDDSDSGIDYEIPDSPTPEPIPNANPTPALTPGGAPIAPRNTVYEFCPVKQQGSGRSVKLTAKTRSAMLRKIPQVTLQDKRDRALLAILGQRAMPLGAFVNSRVSDYDPLSGVLILSTQSKKQHLKVKLRKQAQTAVSSYLASDGAPRETLAPLFANVSTQSKSTVRMQALCIPDLRAMLKVRMRQSKVSMSQAPKSDMDN